MIVLCTLCCKHNDFLFNSRNSKENRFNVNYINKQTPKTFSLNVKSSKIKCREIIIKYRRSLGKTTSEYITIVFHSMIFYSLKLMDVFIIANGFL